MQAADAEPYTHPRHVAAGMPAKPAFLMWEGASLPYSELVSRADQAAQLFRSLGIRSGDTVAFFTENSIWVPELCWAAKNSGLYYVSISSQLNAADYCYLIENSEAKLVVTMRKLAGVALAARQGQPDLPLLLTDGDARGFISYDSLMAEQPTLAITGVARGASMLYSSGTTGRPKGVRAPLQPLPPETPPPRQKMLVESFGFSAATVFINPGPLYHAAPLRMMMAVQRLGGTVIGFDKFDPQLTLAAIERHKATHGFFVPTMFNRMLRLPADVRARYDLSSMRVAIHSAAPCPQPIKRAMLDWWGPVIYEIYGGTEGMGHTIITPHEWVGHPGSVGLPPPGCELEIRDDQGAALPIGETGLVYFRNANRFAYFKDEATTAGAYAADGFSTLGDIGHVDSEGFLYLTDRQANMIISGGVNIYPQEAEAVLITHPAIADVAVIGVPDDDYGEQVKAIVEPHETPADPAALEAELIAFCRNRLTALKCPRSVDFVDRLTRNDLGKLAKHELRAFYWQRQSSLLV